MSKSVARVESNDATPFLGFVATQIKRQELKRKRESGKDQGTGLKR